MHLLTRGFGVSLDKGRKSNEEIRKSTGSRILYYDLACGISPEIFFFGGERFELTHGVDV